MAFPTLFPDATGDPTNTATMRDVTLGDKVKHLIKFAENINGEWVYRFARHHDLLTGHLIRSKGTDFLVRVVYFLSTIQVRPS